VRVLVTGGTGFVGAHSVRALLDAGHEVRLLVRAPERVRPALDPLGGGEVETAVGDVRDEAAVRAAAESGLDPIVHVSSYVALLPPPPDGRITADAPVGRPAGPYARSKAQSEAIARRLQDEGAPVVITQPGAVWGPHDPHLGENARLALTILRGQMPVVLPGPMSIVDVRDVAAAHAAVMRPGQGARRFLLVAGDVPFAELFDVFREATGRRLPALPLPRALVERTVGRLSRVPGELEGPWYVIQRARCDSSAAEAALGLRLRPPRESVLDTIRWLHDAGHVDDGRAGRRRRLASRGA